MHEVLEEGKKEKYRGEERKGGVVEGGREGERERERERKRERERERERENILVHMMSTLATQPRASPLTQKRVIIWGFSEEHQTGGCKSEEIEREMEREGDT